MYLLPSDVFNWNQIIQKRITFRIIYLTSKKPETNQTPPTITVACNNLIIEQTLPSESLHLKVHKDNLSDNFLGCLFAQVN